MRVTKTNGWKLCALACGSVGIIGTGLAPVALAAPYASGISVSGSTVTLSLNEPADSLTIVRDDVPFNLGAQARGRFSVSRGTAANFSLIATDVSGAGYLTPTGANTAAALIVSDDTNVRNSFFSPRGLAVNTNPANGINFGRVYVSTSITGATTGVPTPVRTTGDGIYINYADGSDAVGQGNTALSAGVNWSNGGSASPWRLALDEAGFLYAADFSDSNGTVYRATANGVTGQNLLVGLGGNTPALPTASRNHGSVGGLVVTGSAASNNLTLFTIDEDLTPNAPAATGMNGLWRYNLNSTTTGFTGLPTQLSSGHLRDDIANSGLTTDVARSASTGYFYLSQQDSDGNSSGLFVLNAAGTIAIYSSLDDTQRLGLDGNGTEAGAQDVLRGIRGIDVSRDSRRMALAHDDGSVSVLPLIDGIPDTANRVNVTLPNSSAFNRDVAFDAAGNIWVINSFDKFLRALSPGGPSVTQYNSTGTFTASIEPSAIAAGNFSDSTRWAAGVIPSGNTATARVDNVALNVDAPVTVANLVLEGNAAVSGQSITLSSIQEPRVLAVSGNSTVASVLQVNQPLTVGVWQGATLSITSAFSAPSITLTKAGRGTLTMPSGFTAGVLEVRSGELATAAFTSGLRTVMTQAISINSDDATAELNLSTSDLIVNYTGTNPLADLQVLVDSSRLTFAGDVSGVPAGLVLLNAADAPDGATTFNGIAIDETTVVGIFTYNGDANLDRVVDAFDYSVIDDNFGTGPTPAPGRLGGDLNGDGVVDSFDYSTIDDAFGAALPWAFAPLNAGDRPAASTEVFIPEPGMMGLPAIAALVMLRRRK